MMHKGGNHATKILYLSADGILQPLAYSQVARILMGLADRGFDIDLLSAERPEDLENWTRVSTLESELSSRGVSWQRVTWKRGSAADTGSNLTALFRATRERCARGGVRLLHCRGYHTAGVAWPVHRRHRIPYLFDARGYWIDERADEGRWFRHPLALRAARGVEKRLYLDAEAVVTLTRIQQDDLVRGSLGFVCQAPVQTIPTCADYDAFRPDLPEAPGPWQEVWKQAGARRIVAIVGSINASYRTDETLRLAHLILQHTQDAFLLVLSAQVEEFERRLSSLGIDPERYAVRRANHTDMPQWLRRADWALSLLGQQRAKRASMPTKLAELFAAGVRPIHYGCNDEVTGWVKRAGSGYTLESLRERDLATCAQHIASANRPANELVVARERTREHFSLQSGLARYEQLFARLGVSPSSPSQT